MIKNIKFSNFHSFFEEVEISFEVSKKPASSMYDINISDATRLNKVVAIIGANGSGKTQLIKPLAFLSWFISDSFLGVKPDADIPFQTHMLHKDSDSSFELIFLINEDEYRYKLIINHGKIIYEALFKKTSAQFSYVFIREADITESDAKYKYKHKGFDFPALEALKIRNNASLISAAYNHDTLLASKLVSYFGKYSYNLNVTGRYHFQSGDILQTAEYFSHNTILKIQMEEVMCNIDTGLNSVSIKETQIKSAQGEQTQSFIPFGKHLNSLGEFTLPFFEESSGTQSAFVLLGRILPVLEKGGVAIIDEIDNDLHPHLLSYFVELFKFSETNPHNAQIIFTCHTPEVLNLLMKHQIFLVEKQDQVSEAWRLDQVAGIRADDNLYAKYMAGALEAIPDV